MANRSSALAVALAAGLLGAAALKVEWLLATSAGAPLAGRTLPFGIAAGLECALAIGLLRRGSRSLTAWLVACGFAGAGLATIAVAYGTGFDRPCSCLGRIQTSHGTALLVQGAIVLLSGIVAQAGRQHGD